MSRTPRIWLSIAPVALALLDLAVIAWVHAQGWTIRSSRLPPVETPGARWLLEQHSLAMPLNGLAWVALLVAAVTLLPRRLALVLALAVTMGHAYSVATLTLIVPGGSTAYWLRVLLAVVLALLVAATWERFRGRDAAGGDTKPGWRAGRLRLCYAPVAALALDLTVTISLLSEPWIRRTGRVFLEGSPLARWLLEQHPLALAGSGVAYVALVVAAVLLLPRRLALVTSFAVALGHAYGFTSWTRHVPGGTPGYWLRLGLFVLFAALIVLPWERAATGATAAGANRGPSASHPSAWGAPSS